MCVLSKIMRKWAGICLLWWCISPCSCTVCVPCEEDTFCFNASLYTCPGNSHSSPMSSDLSDCICNAGFFKSAGNCQPCNAPFFCVGDGLQRTCPGLSATLWQFANSSLDCVCLPGSEPQGDECRRCVAGYSKALAGNVSCAECPANTYSSYTGSETCTNCPVLHFSPGGSTRVQQCKLDRAFAKRRRLQQGKKAFSLKVLLPYPPSAFSAARALALRQKTARALQVALETVVITGFKLLGSLRRLLADTTEVSLETTDSVQVSVANATAAMQEELASDNATVAEVTEVDLFLDELVFCPLGSFLFNQSYCVDCAQGEMPIRTYSVTHNASSNASCLSCPDNSLVLGNLSGTSASDCVCDAGYAVGAPGSCEPCAPGHFSNVNSTCVACAAGKYTSVAGSRSCLPCPPYSHSSTGQAICSCDVNHHGVLVGDELRCVCDVGFFRSSAGSCVMCAPGTFKNVTGDGACLSCAVGTYQPMANAEYCESCPPHATTLQEATVGLTGCLCEAGYGELDGVCWSCENNTFKGEVADSACSVCPASSHVVDDGTRCVPCDDSMRQSADGRACECTSGHFDAGVSCQPCAPGTFKSRSGNESCSPCPAGAFSAAAGAALCEICPAGTFQTQTGQTECVSCPPHSSSPDGATSTDACACDEGFQKADGDTGECVPCALGTVKGTLASNATAAECLCLGSALSCDGCCIYCPDGYSTATNGSTAFDDCTPCPADTFSVRSGAQICQPCPHNRVSPPASPNLSACVCRAGFVEDDFGNCEACVIGKYKTLADTACRACPEGMSSPQASPDIASCFACPIGTLESNGVCLDCPAHSVTLTIGNNETSACLCDAGYFGSHDTSCLACPAGHYKAAPGEDPCLQCAPGTYNPASNATTCLACTANSLSAAGSTQASQCDCNTGFEKQDNGTCKMCGAGKYQDGSGVCTACGTNQYYAVSSPPYKTNRCTNCPAMSEAPAAAYGLDACTCLSGYHRSDATTCVPCAENFFCSNEHVVVACPANSTSVPRSVSITDCTCDAGFFRAEDSCVACLQHHFCDNETIAACPGNSTTAHGTLAQAVEQCQCFDGFYFDATTATCIRCPADSFCFSNSLTHCPSNSRAAQGSGGVDSCRCDADYQKNESDMCDVCPPDVLCLGGSTDPQQCAERATVSTAYTCMCPDGYFCSEGASCVAPAECVACPPDSYCTGNEETDCMSFASSSPQSVRIADCVCKPGYHRVNDTCLSCLVGEYCNGEQKYLCTDFDPFLVLANNASASRSECTCPAGMFRVHRLDACKPCPKDFYCPAEVSVPLPNVIACLENEYTLHEGMTQRSDCICDAGHKMNSDGEVTKCLPCEEGERCLNGEVVEFQCELFKRTANAEHTKCICISGFFENVHGDCEPCPAGFVKDAPGDQPCVPCAADFFPVNSTSCAACGAGKFAESGFPECLCIEPFVNVDGACKSCGQDLYRVLGATALECAPCPANSQTANGSAATSVFDCECVDGFVRDIGPDQIFTACVPCPANTYELDGECVPCQTFSHSAPASFAEAQCTCNSSLCKIKAEGVCVGSCTDAVVNCSACTAGFFKAWLSAAGTDHCLPCSYDTFNADSAQVACDVCPNNSITTHLASTRQADCLCDAGYEPRNVSIASSGCSACRLGYHKPSYGNLVCDECSIGSFSATNAATVCSLCALHAPVTGANTTLAVGSNSSRDCTCDVGLSLQQNACAPCAVGSFKDHKGFDACHVCGSFLTTEYGHSLWHHYGDSTHPVTTSLHCQPCPNNSGIDPSVVSYTNMASEVQNCSCFGGFELFSVSSGCTACDSFKVRPGYGKGACVYCPDDHYFDRAHMPCPQCYLRDLDAAVAPHVVVFNSLNYSLSWGTSELDCTCRLGSERQGDLCHACAQGWFRGDPHVIGCRMCSNSSFSSSPRSTACTDCPPNSGHTLHGSATVDDCLCYPGHEWNGTHCLPCAPGTFKADYDTAEQRGACQVCDDGTYSSLPAMTTCSSCSANELSLLPRDSPDTCACRPGFGGDPCARCEVGLYSLDPSIDQSHAPCRPCPSGKTTLNHSATDVSHCVCQPGHGTADASLEAICEPCPDGFYSPGFSNQACQHCGIGGITDPKTGATHFDACLCDASLGLFHRQV